MRLKHKIAIVTGAANGIGLSVAGTFIKEALQFLWQILTVKKLKPKWVNSI